MADSNGSRHGGGQGRLRLAGLLCCGVMSVVWLMAGSAVQEGGRRAGSGRTLTATPAAGAAVADQPANGETYRWRRVAVGGGGFITGYAVDPKGQTRVVRTDVYGAYLWREDLDRWVQLVNSDSMPEADRSPNGVAEGVFEIVVAPSDPARIYMAVKGLVYRSDDRGAHFTSPTHSAPFPLAFDANSEFRFAGPFLAVCPRNPDVVLFGTPQNGLWRSDDAGRRWVKVESVPDSRGSSDAGGQAAVLWFEPARAGRCGGRLWAMAPGSGMYVSDDEGRSFERLSLAEAPRPRSLTQGAFAADGSFFGADREGCRLWRFRDRAWSDLTPLIGEYCFAAVAVNPRNGQIFVFDVGGRGWRSGDGGASWWPVLHSSQQGQGDPPWLRVSNKSYFAMGPVVFDPIVADRLWVGSGTGVYYADLGSGAMQVRWTSQTRGIEELVATDVIKPSGQAPLFAALDFGIHVKDDLARFSEGYGPKERVLIAAQQLAWSPADPAFIVTNASDTRTSCCSEDGDAVLAGFSRDGGRHWEKFGSMPRPPGAAPNDPWRMSFGSIAVASNDTGNIVWLPGFDRAPFFTRDAGVHWHRVRLAGEVLPNTGSFSSIWYQRKTLAADPVLPGVFYLLHSGGGANAGLAGVWRTRDGGERWERVFRGEVAPQSQYAAKLRPMPGRAGDLFFTSGLSGGDDTRLRHSRDGGASWSVVPGVKRVDDIGFGRAAGGAAEATIYLSGQVEGRYGIWRSTDDAASWTRIGAYPVGTLDQVTVIAGDPDRFGRVYLGYKGSGWIYGQPEPCQPHAFRFLDAAECAPAGPQIPDRHFVCKAGIC